MELNHSQKKYLKKNLKRFPLTQIANKLKISEKEILHYLKSSWPKEKYKKFVEKINGYGKQTERATNFNLKNFFQQNWKILLFLAFLVSSLYFNSLGNDFVSDDISSIRDNPNIKNPSFFIFPNPPFFSPLNFLRFIIYHLFGLNPAFYRLANIFSHLFSTWAIYFLMGLFFASPINLFVASLFAVHPILTESVTWISGGPYSIATMFTLFSFSAYIVSLRNKNLGVYLFSLLMFFIALLFFEKIIIFPLILLVYEFTLGNLKNNWRKLIPFFGITLLGAVYLVGLFGVKTVSLQTYHYQEPGLENPLIKIPIAIVSYLGLIFWPKNLTLYHSELTFTQIEYLIRLILFILFLAVIIFFFKKDRRVSFWLLFFLISLSPTLTPFKISWAVAERYVNLGIIGIFVLIAFLIQKIGQIFKKQKVSYVIFAIIILALSARTIFRNFDWRNQDTLWVSASKTSPSSHQNHNNLGDMYARRGDYQKAIEEFQKAIELKPNYGDAYHNLANIYHLRGQDDLALENYQKALEFNPNIWQSYQNIAAIYFIQKKLDLAKQTMEKALALNPNNAELHTNMGIIYSNLGEKQKAKEEFEKALQIDPQNQKAKQLLLSL